MFLTVHSAAGAIIGISTGNVWLAFILGFISHYVLDAIPHGDETMINEDKTKIGKKDIKFLFKIATVDGLTMTAILATLYWYKLVPLTLPVLAGIAGSIAPDFINGLYLITKSRFLEKAALFHFNLHFLLKIKIPFWAGMIVQLVSLIIFILTLTII